MVLGWFERPFGIMIRRPRSRLRANADEFPPVRPLTWICEVLCEDVSRLHVRMAILQREHILMEGIMQGHNRHSVHPLDVAHCGETARPYDFNRGLVVFPDAKRGLPTQQDLPELLRRDPHSPNTSVKATMSASGVLCDTQPCFLHCPAIGYTVQGPKRVRCSPLVERDCLLSPAKSASANR